MNGFEMGALQPIEQKAVDFMGTELLAIKTTAEKVFVAVNYVCQGIGFNENQRDRQVKNAKEDVVVSQGVMNLPVKFDGQVRNVFCIELDYLPLWLAKISITPKMQQETPWLTENLIKYQMKAKEVLAEAFLEKQRLPSTPTEMAKLSLQAVVEQGERLSEVEMDLKDLKSKQPLYPAQAAHVQKEVKRRVYAVLNEYFGGNKGGLKKLFSAINTDIHKAFGVPNRGMIPQLKHEEAVQFVRSWQPDSVVRYQLSLELNENSEAG